VSFVATGDKTSSVASVAQMAINRHVERVFNPDAKKHPMGQTTAEERRMKSKYLL